MVSVVELMLLLLLVFLWDLFLTIIIIIIIFIKDLNCIILICSLLGYVSFDNIFLLQVAGLLVWKLVKFACIGLTYWLN